MRMADGHIPKDPLYGEFVQGKRPRGRSQLQYKDICKRDLKVLGMDLNRWETLTFEHSAWRHAVQMTSPNLKTHLFSRPRQRGSPKTNKIRKLDRGQIVFVFSVEGIVTLKLAFSATLDIVPRLSTLP